MAPLTLIKAVVETLYVQCLESFQNLIVTLVTVMAKLIFEIQGCILEQIDRFRSVRYAGCLNELRFLRSLIHWPCN